MTSNPEVRPAVPEPPSVATLSPTRFWLGMLPALLLPLLGSLLYFVVFGESKITQAIYGALKIFTLLWPLLCYWLLWKLPLPKPRWKIARPLPVLALGLLSGLAILAVMAIAMQTPIATAVYAAEPKIRVKAIGMGVLDHYWLFSGFMILAHSLIEEYYWRWFTFGKLHERIHPLLAYLLGAAAFSAHHVVVLSQYFSWPYTVLFSLSVAVGGILWSWMLVRQRTLFGAWISHALVDFGIFYIGYRLLLVN